MFKHLKYTKVAALIAAVVSGGNLFALSSGGPSGGMSVTVAQGANVTSYQSNQSTASETVLMPILVSLKTDAVLELVSAVAGEAASAMSDSGDTMPESGSKKIAGSAGSAHKASSWVRTSFTAIDSQETNQNWSGQQYMIMAGADYRFNKIFAAGLGLGYTRLQSRTEFNNGHMRINTYSVNPYLVIVASKNINFEVVGGWDAAKGNDDRTQNFTLNNSVPASTAKYKSSPKSNTYFGGIFMNLIQKMNKGHVSGQIGYLAAQTTVKAFNESTDSQTYALFVNKSPKNTFKVGRANAKIKGAYHLTDTVSPYVIIHGSYDVKQADVVAYTSGAKSIINRSSYGAGFGVKARQGEAFNTSLEFDYTQRGKLYTYRTALNLHYGF